MEKLTFEEKVEIIALAFINKTKILLLTEQNETDIEHIKRLDSILEKMKKSLKETK